MENGTYKLEDGRIVICINNVLQVYNKTDHDVLCSHTRSKLFGRLAKQNKTVLLSILQNIMPTDVSSYQKLSTGKMADMILWLPKQTCTLSWVQTSGDESATNLRKALKGAVKV